MLGERRSKSAFYAGFGESVQEETASAEPTSEQALEHAPDQSTDWQVGTDDPLGNKSWVVQPEAEMEMDGDSNQQQEEVGPRQGRELQRDVTDEEEYVPPERPGLLQLCVPTTCSFRPGRKAVRFPMCSGRYKGTCKGVQQPGDSGRQ